MAAVTPIEVCSNGSRGLDTAASTMTSDRAAQKSKEAEPDSSATPASSCLRRAANVRWLLCWMCCASVIQGMVINGYVNVAISTIEKRYNLPSRDTGLISSSYDIACVFVSIPFSYFGSRPGASKPRWVGLGLILMGLGSLVFALPHLTAPPYIDPTSGEKLTDGVASPLLAMCSTNSSSASSECDGSDRSWLSNYKYVFILGQVLHGVGAVPLYTLGVALIDESVSPRLSSYYLGIFYATAVIGPAIGYGLGGQFLRIYVDSPAFSASQLGLTQSSDLWLGAWWIGFFITGIGAIMVAIPVLMMPAVIPRAQSKSKEEQGPQQDPSSEDVLATGATAFKHLDGLKFSSISLLKNRTFVALSVSETFDGFMLAGMAAFMPKFIENQFSMTASTASLVVGAISIPAGGGATFLGGWTIKKFSLSCLNTIKMCFIVSLFCLCFTFALIIHCPNNEFAGVNRQYGSDTSTRLPSLQSSCNSHCSCELASYTPVCGANGVTYYSPCHAGCTQGYEKYGYYVRSECSCIEALPQNYSSTFEKLKPNEALLNKCPSACPYFTLFLGLLFVSMFLLFFTSIPNVNTTLRCVRDDERAYSLGLQAISFRLFGTIPSPILFGLALDQACQLWGESCGSKGSCLSYDNYYTSRYFFALVVCSKAVSTVGFLCAFIFYRRKTDVDLKHSVTALPTVTSHGEMSLGSVRGVNSAYDNRALDLT